MAKKKAQPKTKEPKFVLKEGHQVKEVSLGGRKYYEFVDTNMAPCHRMYAAMTFYNELQMRCDRSYLIAHCTAVQDILNGVGGHIDLLKLGQLTLQMKERLEWILEPETILKYASVVFFDETENPYDYDYKYNMTVKIKRWKDMGLSSFFLSMPVKRLFPALNSLGSDLGIYLKTLMELDQAHLETVLESLSKQHSTKDWYNTLELRRQEGQRSAKSSAGHGMTT